MNLPQGLPPLPPVPEGFDRWIDRGTKWGAECATYASTPLDAKFAGEWVVHHDDPAHGSPVHHYIEAVREPAEPSAQLFATLDPENGEEVGEPADDHKDCRDGCRYSYELGDGRQRVCPYGECQRNNPRLSKMGEPAKDQPASGEALPSRVEHHLQWLESVRPGWAQEIRECMASGVEARVCAMTDRPTPLTDKEAMKTRGTPLAHYVRADFARELERKLAEARTALEDIKGRCSDMSIALHPDADAKGCVDDCWEWSEQALARIDEKGTA